MKYFLAILFLLFNFMCFSQDYKIQFPLTKYIFSHTLNAMDIDYCGDLNDVELSSNDAVITKSSLGKYSIKTENEGYIEVYIYNNVSKLSDTLKILVKKFPTPVVKLNTYSIDNTIKQIVANSSSLRTENEDLACWDVNDSALTFDLTIIKNKDIYKFKNQKNPFAENIKKILHHIEIGDLVIFNSIKFDADPFKIGDLNNLVYEIE